MPFPSKYAHNSCLNAFFYFFKNSKHLILLKYSCINHLRISSLAACVSQQWDTHCPLLGNKCTSVFNYLCFSYPAVVESFDVSQRSHWSNLIKNRQCWKTKTRSNCPVLLPCASFQQSPPSPPHSYLKPWLCCMKLLNRRSKPVICTPY